MKYSFTKLPPLYIAIMLLLAISCDTTTPSTQIKDDLAIPPSGETPLPRVAGTSYQEFDELQKGEGYQIASQRVPDINWTVIKPLLAQAQQQTGDQYAAIYSVRNSDEGSYYYQTAPLQFSARAIQEANGDIRPYFFQSYAKPNDPQQLFAAYIPDSDQAMEELETWILSKLPPDAVIRNPNRKLSKESRVPHLLEQCFIPDYSYMMLNEIVIVGHYEECIEVGRRGGGGMEGGGPADPGDTPCYLQLIPTPECQGAAGDVDECPLQCNAGGSGGGSGEQLTISFRGEIDASDLANHPKANCIYGKLSQTHTMEKVVSAFAGKSTNFDLVIEVDNVDGGYGTLNSRGNSSTFTMKLDEEGILQRKSIETAVTFMHEAIHAEMRRFLYNYEAERSTSLPGFPGDFNHDWNLFVSAFYDGDVEEAEHEAMAVKYRNIIVNGLKGYDNSELTTEEYEALAWHGLSNTRYYRDVLNDQEKQAIVDNRKSALNKTTDSCN